MKNFSQQNLKRPAAESEHAVRKAEFDAAVGDLRELQTESKMNLVTAINEVYQGAGSCRGSSDSESGKTAVAYALGLPSSSSDSFTQLADRIQNDKTNLATFLTSRHVAGDAGDSLSNLLTKLYSIPERDNHAYQYRLLTLNDFPIRNSSNPKIAEGRYWYHSSIYCNCLFCFIF